MFPITAISWLAIVAEVIPVACLPREVVRQQNSDLPITSCPGYVTGNLTHTLQGLTADLKLNGPACNTYGQDIEHLKLEATFETENRIHVKIYDAAEDVYQIPDKVFPRPVPQANATATEAEILIQIDAQPFSFAIYRPGGQTLFNTSWSNLIFQSQYLRLRTQLPASPHLYGLGEHADPFMLNNTDYTRTLWSRDASYTPPGTNLYGNHPVYFDHRGSNGTHGVFMLNSNGMDIKINNTEEDGQYLEYNMLGGVIDLYFMTGPTPNDVSRQYSQVAGLPAMMPYWGFGLHQCRYGYRDVYEDAQVVANYSAAGIPLETMWTDIDYMNLRQVFTLDPDRYPLEKMRELVSTLHDRQQHYVLMVDPAVSYNNYSAFAEGVQANAFLKNADGSVYQGVVWPGVTAFPDWFASGTQRYWDDQFASFFNADTGVDIDALWIDMNEPSNFCDWPCTDARAFAEAHGLPPSPPSVRKNAGQPIPGFPADFQPSGISKRQASNSGSMIGLAGRDLLNPPYTIGNVAGGLSNSTIATDILHENGLALYDTHNLYGTMMSTTSRNAMLARRPGKRPMVITRSTFAGAGARVGHWLGDNAADWPWYRYSISSMLQFAALYQIPMVGADVCGFNGNSWPELCARWALLGAFYPFYRNHAYIGTTMHEFYQWPLTTTAAKKAIDMRYGLLDYIYTAFWRQTQTGTPLLQPLFFAYPNDTNTFPIEYQFFYGDGILVSPVTDDNSTAVTFYLPDDLFYDFFSLESVRGNGEWVTRENVDWTDIPVHIRGGTILPLRQNSANTTTELRKQDFELIVAPGLDGTAKGELYLDEGELIEQPATSLITFEFSNGTLTTDGTFAYQANVSIASVVILAESGGPILENFLIPLTGPWSIKFV